MKHVKTKIEKIENELNEKGYATFDFLTAAELNALTQIVYELQYAGNHQDVHVATPFRLSAFNNSAMWKEQIYSEIYVALKQKLDSLFADYEPLVINIFEKLPHTGDNSVAIHQNPSFVAEPEFKSLSLWIPLVDVGQHNGTLGVLEYSHDVFDAVRAANMPDVFDSVAHLLQKQWFKALEVSKGKAVLLDDSLIHWSYPNYSDHVRTAVQLICVPRNTRHIYYYYNTDQPDNPKMDLFDVTKDFFFQFNCKAEPVGLKKIDSIPYQYVFYTEKEFKRKMMNRSPLFPKEHSFLNRVKQILHVNS